MRGVSDGATGATPTRLHYRGASMNHLAAFYSVADGLQLADVVAWLGSMDLVLGEIDR